MTDKKKFITTMHFPHHFYFEFSKLKERAFKKGMYVTNSSITIAALNDFFVKESKKHEE